MTKTTKRVVYQQISFSPYREIVGVIERMSVFIRVEYDKRTIHRFFSYGPSNHYLFIVNRVKPYGFVPHFTLKPL